VHTTRAQRTAVIKIPLSSYFRLRAAPHSGLAFSSSRRTMPLGYCVAAALIALPLALDHDDPLAIRLEAAAATLPVGPRSELLSSAQLRRATLTSTLTRDSQASVAMAFETLLRLAQSRSELAALDANAINPVAVAIDKKIAFAVHTLRRAFAASDSLAAMADTADATAIGQLDAVSSSLEALREELAPSRIL
jgi:hypothetical protein